MDWIKPVKDIFRCFSADKSSFTIVQVNGQKGKAGSPFIVKPAASKNRLPGLIVSHIIQDQQEDVTAPAIICFQKNRNNKQTKNTEKLYWSVIFKIFYGTKSEISQEKGKKYVLFFVV